MAAKKPPAQMTWYKVDPTRWLTDIRWMPATTSHVYTVITMLALEREEPLPEDRKRLAKYAGIGQAAFEKALDALIDDGIVWRTKDGILSDFIARSIEDRIQRSGKSKKAARARWVENTEKTTADECASNAQGMPLEQEEHTPSVEETEGGFQPPLMPSSSSTSIGNGSSGRRTPDGAPPHPFKVDDDVFHGRDCFTVQSFHGDRVQLRDVETGDTSWKLITECSTMPPADDEDELDSDIPF